MKKFLPLILLLLLGVQPTLAQSTPPTQPTLRLQRNFGYGGFGQDIQGLFTLSLENAESVSEVQFLLDGQALGTRLLAAPWQVQFSTDNYPTGEHTFSAQVILQDGREINPNPITAKFLSAAQVAGGVKKFAVPIVGGILALMGIGILASWHSSRQAQPVPLGTERTFGWLGGAICPNCARPFSRHWWALNISFVGKFDRCPHCGRWNVVRRASPGELSAAIQAEKPAEPTPTFQSPAQKRAQQIEDSRYDG
ncbi:MAG TPA: Ig-like domain-containing protein [Anaerolineales bacterium]|nr:Ig-like domain-containing protein [Anaerolineales bacterium]